VRSLNKERQETYANVENAKRVWGLALRLSALSYVGPQEFEKGSLPDSLVEAFRAGDGIAPTEAFQELVGLTVSRMHALHDASHANRGQIRSMPLQGFQERDQVRFLGGSEVEAERGLVVVNDVGQSCGNAVVKIRRARGDAA
jgi:hypothetical protein